MYNIDFFKNTFDVKQKIVNGSFCPGDKDRIFSEFDLSLSAEPYVFNIETTSYCNMKCVMCQRATDFKRKSQHMAPKSFERIVSQISPHTNQSFEDWQKFVDRHLRNGDIRPSENNFYFDVVSRCVTLHGFGEPLLDPHMPDRVALLTSKDIPSYFSCNPCNIKLDFISELFKAGLGYIKFAIDSLNDAEAKQLRGQPADFTKSYEKLLQVIELKKKMQAESVIVVTMLNIFDNAAMELEFLDLWKDEDVYAYVKSVDNKWLLSKKDELETTAENKSHYSGQYCEYAWTSVTILVDGSVVPCTQDINGSWVFGNVNNDSLSDIWRSEKYQEFRNLHICADTPEDFMCKAKCDCNIVADYYR